MNRKIIRTVLGVLIIAITIYLFGWYISKNPEILQQLKATSPLVVLLILAAYGGVLGVLMLVLVGSLHFYKKKMSVHENFLLNAYSSLVNFFGPGQSGPGFRAAYLKLKHNVLIKQYLFITLVYYAFYALFSSILFSAVAFPPLITLGLVVVIIIGCIAIMKVYLYKNKNILKNSSHNPMKPILIIGCATLLQVLLLWLLYFIELRSFDSSISAGQAAAYTGAANFALFVSLTPGAIGFREAFLLFSQNVHNISNDLIIAANVLDRAVYILFLGILFLFILTLHAGRTLQVAKIKQLEDKEEGKEV